MLRANRIAQIAALLALPLAAGLLPGDGPRASGAPARDADTVASVARDFLRNLEDGRLHEAYGQTSAGFQADIAEHDLLSLASFPPNFRDALPPGAVIRNQTAIRALSHVITIGEAQVSGTLARVRFLELPGPDPVRAGASLPKAPLTAAALDAMAAQMRQLFAPYAAEMPRAEIDEAIRWACRELREQKVTETVRGTLPRLNYLHLVKQGNEWRVIPFLRIQRRYQPDPKAPGKAVVDYAVQIVFHPTLLRRPPDRLHLVIYEVDPERCRRCGNSLAAQWNFCPTCGTPRERLPVDPPAAGAAAARREEPLSPLRGQGRLAGVALPRQPEVVYFVRQGTLVEPSALQPGTPWRSTAWCTGKRSIEASGGNRTLSSPELLRIGRLFSFPEGFRPGIRNTPFHFTRKAGKALY